MPSTSAKQHRFMEMVAHDPAAAKRLGVPQSVGRDFVAADRAKAAGPKPDSDPAIKIPPPHHKSHDAPMKTPGRQHGTHDMPTRPGAGRAGC